MRTKILCVVAMLAPFATANAAELASGAQISEAITGNTVQGSMEASGVYTEYYAATGVVHGQDYKAMWSVEGNSMCWVYEGSPKDCWDVAITDDQVTWIKDGESAGTGTILLGNPNNF